MDNKYKYLIDTGLLDITHTVSDQSQLNSGAVLSSGGLLSPRYGYQATLSQETGFKEYVEGALSAIESRRERIRCNIQDYKERIVKYNEAIVESESRLNQTYCEEREMKAALEAIERLHKIDVEVKDIVE